MKRDIYLKVRADAIDAATMLAALEVYRRSLPTSNAGGRATRRRAVRLMDAVKAGEYSEQSRR